MQSSTFLRRSEDLVKDLIHEFEESCTVRIQDPEDQFSPVEFEAGQLYIIYIYIATPAAFQFSITYTVSRPISNIVILIVQNYVELTVANKYLVLCKFTHIFFLLYRA